MAVGIYWEIVARDLAHPTAIAVLELLAGLDDDGRLSPKAMSDELDLPVGVVAYHVQRLLAAKLIKRAGSRQRRGAREHFYRLTVKARSAD